MAQAPHTPPPKTPATKEAPAEPDHMEDIATEQRRRSDALQAEGAAEAAKHAPPPEQQPHGVVPPLHQSHEQPHSKR